MSSFQDLLRLYDYPVSPEMIAQEPASPRDSARLLVYDRTSKTEEWTTFHHLPQYLPANAVLVLNKTKVIPARLHLQRSTSGNVAALITRIADDSVIVMANRKLKPSELLTCPGTDVTFMVLEEDGKYWKLKPSLPLAEIPAFLRRVGEMPLPPYIKHSPLKGDALREAYQSVFAQDEGSIAAPTASLHFTPELLKQIEERGVTITYVTLHVHLGTFAPLTEEQVALGQLHEEEYSISRESVAVLTKAKRDGRPIIAVGTTVLRTLESATDEEGNIAVPEGRTRLFIREGYRFRLVHSLITNFHVPRSSLLMLVCAFAGRTTILDLYRKAISKKCRFFSFGDGMLLR